MEAHKCMFCAQSFLDSNAFWEHMVSGSCNQEVENVPSQSPRIPCSLPNPNPVSSPADEFVATPTAAFASRNSQSRANGIVDNWNNKTPPPRENKLIFKPVQPPSPPDAPPDSTQLARSSAKKNGVSVDSSTKNCISNLLADTMQCSSAISQTYNNMPTGESCQSPLTLASNLSMPTACFTVANSDRISRNSTLINGFSHESEVSSRCLGGPPITASNQSKWKCILCAVEFSDRAAMVNHVRSTEHEAKVLMAKGPRGDSASPKVDSPQESSKSINGDLSEMIRQIVREEFPSLFRKEFRKLFDFALREDAGDISPNGNEIVSRTPLSDIDNKVIIAQGNYYRCLACNCSITSQGNLTLHVEGKKHRSNLGRFANSRFQGS